MRSEIFPMQVKHQLTLVSAETKLMHMLKGNLPVVTAPFMQYVACSDP